MTKRKAKAVKAWIELAGVEGYRAVSLPQRDEGGCSAPHGSPRLSNIAPSGGQVGGNFLKVGERWHGRSDTFCSLYTITPSPRK